MKQETQFSLFRALSTKTPPTLITLKEAYRLITTDNSLRENTEKFRYFKSQGFEKEADEIKRTRCLAFTPAAVFEQYRRYNCITTITQYSMVDIDNLTEAEAVRLMELLKADPYWLLAYITLSGKGIRIIFRVEGVTDQKSYLKAFYQGNDHYCRLLGVIHDDQVKDMTRSSGLCHDPNALYRAEAQVFQVDYNKVVVAEVWKTIEDVLAKRGCDYKPGKHNEYISQAGYLLNAYGVDETEATEWLQRRFPDYDPGRTESHVRSCYNTCAHEHGTLKPGARPRGGKSKKSAKPRTELPKYLSVEEIENSLQELADFRWNEITRLTEIRWKDREEGFRPMADRDEGSLWSRINKQQKPMKFADLRLVLGSEFVPTHHPFKAYFYGLPKWEGSDTNYIKELAETVTLADDSPEARYTFYHCLKKWLVAMVAGFLSDRVNHEILVLIGRQGIYKTTWFHFLLPPELRNYYVAKNNSRRMNKDDRLLMAEAGLICLEEIVTMTDEEVDQIKAAVSLPQVVERAAYARNKEVRPHLASFCGTGNQVNFLTDLTGNRRWLPFEVENILSPYDHPIDYTGLYSQVMHLWQSGFPYWFDQEEIRRLSKHVSRFEVDNLEEDQIRKHFRQPNPGEAYEVYSVADVLSVINLELKTMLSHTKVGMLLNKLGFKKVRKDNRRGYKVYRYTGEEITHNRKGTVMDAEEQELPF